MNAITRQPPRNSSPKETKLAIGRTNDEFSRLRMRVNATTAGQMQELLEELLSLGCRLSSERARAYKPHMAIFERLAQALGVSREEILYVGDSLFADITGAKNAGLQAAWINRKGVRPLEQSAAAASGESNGPIRELREPDVELHSLDELLDLLPR